MGSLKPSVRVRGPGASGPILANGMPGAYNGEELRVFESDQFDANNYVQMKCHSMSEKGMRQLCAELQDLKRASAEEMRRSVYANYTAFIRTSRELSDLEGELLAMRNLLSSQATLIHGLAERTSLTTHLDAITGSSDEESNYLVSEADNVSELELRAQALPDYLDVLLAERKVTEALIALDEGERLAMEGRKEKGDEPFVAPLQAVLFEQRARLAEQLAEAVSQPSVRGADLRSAIAALDKLGEGARAHTLLLKSHHERLKNNIRTLRPSGTSYGGAYTAALSQLVFSAIAQAIWDSAVVFGEEPSYASESVLWARSEVENFAKLVKRHVLSSSAAAGGLRAAAECVEIALGYCVLLEEQGLALSPFLMKLLRPSVEQALDANLKRIEESAAALAAADDWALIAPPASQGRGGGVGVRTSIGSGGSSFANTMKLTSSAHYFNTMLQDFLEDVSPLISMQLAGRTLDALSSIFEGYIGLLIKALPQLQGDEEAPTMNLSNSIVQTAETLSQQLALLGNASALADELLPRAASKLVPAIPPKEVRGRRVSDRQAAHAAARMPELKEWRRRLQREVERLRDQFCQYHTLDLIYNPEDVDAQLSPETYLNLDVDGVDDETSWQQDPMPSRTMQALFAKLTNIAQTAGDLLTGRERVVTVLLQRLTETIVFYLSTDEELWDTLEETGLGPNGLRQFVLDMQFIIQVASHGRYSSRTMRQVVSDTTARAVSAYAATGADPDSVLPEDEWLSSVAREAQRRLLTGWTKGSNTNGELGSPTHSVSAQSVSSVRSE